MKNEISSKLERLGEYLKILRGYQSHTLEDLKNDVTLRGAVERYLEVSIESCLDIGEMIISQERARKTRNLQRGNRDTRGNRSFTRGFCG
ncbi:MULTISPECIES: DUF86 domain-containing protein [Methanothermobacter]|jgi:uncharacterized protein YutE (UPF0331/DUF86 family)|uniref:DUF86 domain-containing protein n=1 Tax=Methanothermobacter TaxID=145260 RepID=UPI000B5F9B05|nr:MULTISPECIES: HepT-like ribonuclease domain-containing protein [Methanothermobacter]MDK2875067.1 hypothetical protein [Methanothermobacter sp.]MDN5374554.1 hypothetical protein [Methanothermobacter sp.]BAZ98450.1 hypothetical protein tca_00375 [Methanothermobacter sp. EMTCatA1]HOQ18930.1 DUF86 domain-containing protein [Methanothermobacter thermautotrophicus]